jgi:hypothetical protein
MKQTEIDSSETKDKLTDPFLLKVVLSIFAICMLLVAYIVSAKVPGDYLNYYYGSTFFLQGIPVAEIYDTTAFNAMIAAEGIEKTFSNYVPVPPFSLLFYYPFTGVDFIWSKILFNGVSILLFTVSLYRLCVQEQIKCLHVCLVLCALIYPVYNNLIQGQSYLLILSLFIEGYLCLLKGRIGLSSFLFALPIALKLFPVIILIWLYATGRKKALLLTVAWTVFLFIVMLPCIGTDTWLSYHTSILPRLLSGEINDPFSVTYQSYSVWLKKLLVYDGMLNPTALLNMPFVYAILNTFVTVFVLQAFIQLIQKYKEQPFRSFGITFFCGLLISGYGTNYSLVLLLFIALALLHNEQRRRYQAIVLVVLFGIAFFQVSKVMQLPLLFQFGRLYLMFALFFILIRKEQIVWFNKQSVVLICLLLLPVAFRFFQKQDQNDYYLSHEPSLFITTYHSCSEGLQLKYIGANGIDSITYKTNDHIHASDQLQIIDNQICLKGTQITVGSDLKKQPAFLNARSIIYLSDQGRGPGLTTLRTIHFR